jgi:hypothetical protein
MNRPAKACIALVAIAVGAVLPTTASATNDATLIEVDNGVHGSPLFVPSNIVATGNHNAFSRLTTADGSIFASCTTNELTGTLTANNHNEVAANITAATFKGKTNVTPHTTHCTGSAGDTLLNWNPPTNGLPWCLQILVFDTTDTFRIRGNSCTQAARPIRFTVQITTVLGNVHCEYQRTGPIIGTYTTNTTPKLKVEKSEFVRLAGSFCPDRLYLDLEVQVHHEVSGVLEEAALINPT